MLPLYEVRPSDLSVKRNQYEVNFPEHMHSYIEILYVFAGAQHITLEGIPYTVNAGDAAIIFPDTIHSFYQSDKKSADELLVIVNPKLFGKIFSDFQKYRPLEPVIPKERLPENVLYALKHIKPEDKFEIKFGWTCIILSCLLEHLELEEQKRMPVQDMSQKIIKYIEENFTQPINRDSLAEVFHVSKNYISYIFSERIRINLRNYLGLVRAEYATMLIRTTDDTLTNISLNAGFESQRTFNRVFHSIYGMSPSEYRNNIHKFIM